MIKELAWDTDFFKKKIGVLELEYSSQQTLIKDLEKAKKNQYQYIKCQLESPDPKGIHLLEANGFYLADISVTWGIEIDKCHSFIEKQKKLSAIVDVATTKDIPALKKLSQSIFVNSRFYSDPFFTKEEADNLHITWTENSVMGKAADIVFHCQRNGFVTCKKLNESTGEIGLIGVKEGCRGKSIGSILMNSSINWFSSCDFKNVIVRTQLKNIEAMNFYRKLGFVIKCYDLVFGKIL